MLKCWKSEWLYLMNIFLFQHTCLSFNGIICIWVIYLYLFSLHDCYLIYVYNILQVIPEIISVICLMFQWHSYLPRLSLAQYSLYSAVSWPKTPFIHSFIHSNDTLVYQYPMHNEYIIILPSPPPPNSLTPPSSWSRQWIHPACHIVPGIPSLSYYVFSQWRMMI